jgi:hypothetical protein
VQSPEDMGVSEPHLLRILIEINQWEDSHRRELQTISGRDLYFRIAATMLEDATDKKKPLKLLSGRITDRATRSRIREFEALGLVDVMENEVDARTRRVIPTGEFIRRLNQHLHMFKRFCDVRYLMVDRS